MPDRLFTLLIEEMQMIKVNGQRRRGAHARLRAPVHTGDVLPAAGLQVEEDITARQLSDLNFALEQQRRNPRRQVGGVVYILRPNADDNAVLAGGQFRPLPRRDRHPQDTYIGVELAAVAYQPRVEEVHRRAAHETGHENIRGPAIKVL